MKFKPLVHQHMMIEHGLTREEFVLFAGMGLGKSAATLAIVNDLIENFAIRAVLIVAPLRVVNLTWPNEVRKWDEFKHLKVVSLRTEEGIFAWQTRSADVYLINYEMLPKFCDEHLKGVRKADMPAEMVVWDELSKAKNPSSKRINEFRKHRHKFTYHCGLTGTPTPNSYMDLFGQIRLIDGGKSLGTAFSKFRKQYFESDYMGYKWALKEGAKQEIEEKISDLVITLSSEDWLDIPDVNYEDHEVELTREGKKTYREFERDLLVKIANDEIEAANGAVLMGKLLQMTGGAVYDDERKVVKLHQRKLEYLKKLIDKIKDPVLVIYQYQHERDRILKAIPGSVIFEEKLMDAWNRREIPVMIANAASIGHGLQLEKGSCNLIWFTLTYSRELYDQTNARLARQGQAYETTIHRIICKDTVDEAVAEALRVKGTTQAGLLDALKNLQQLRLK